MWRTILNPVLHRPVAVLRIPSGNTSTICFVPHNELPAGGNDGKEPTHNINNGCSGNDKNISNAQNVVCSLLSWNKLDKTVQLVYQPLVDINLYLKQIIDKQQDLDEKNHLVICSPGKEKKKEQSGFGFRDVCVGIEKWCYGVVVVSGLISWHRLFLKDDIHVHKQRKDILSQIYNDTPNLYSYVLPVNGPAKPVDPVDAAFLGFQDAIAEGTAVTQNALGIKFSALNMPKKALTYFQSASDKGHSAAHFNLGICYEKGIGTEKNILKAIEAYSFAAAHGHALAAFNLGGIYLEGKYINEKRDEGLKLIEQAAKKGVLEAQRFLGLHYADQSNEHHDMKICVKWLQAAADKNDMTAQYHLGICYEQGSGVGRNMKKAKKLYEVAAEHGHVGAQYNIGVFYENGLGGLSINKREALRWYKMAANGGNVNAKHNLKCLEKEIHDIKKETENCGLLRRLLPNIWSSQELVPTAGVLPRCSSSPGRLYLATDLSHDDTVQNPIQNRTSEEKCIWVI